MIDAFLVSLLIKTNWLCYCYYFKGLYCLTWLNLIMPSQNLGNSLGQWKRGAIILLLLINKYADSNDQPNKATFIICKDEVMVKVNYYYFTGPYICIWACHYLFWLMGCIVIGIRYSFLSPKYKGENRYNRSRLGSAK